MPTHGGGLNGAAGAAAIPADASANGHIGVNGENQGFLLPEKCIPAKVSLLPHPAQHPQVLVSSIFSHINGTL